jgi:TonB family protein
VRPAVRRRTAHLGGALALAACAHTSPLSQAQIDRVVRRHERDIRACYDVGLSREPGLAGRLRVDFVVEPSGATTGARVSDSTLEHAEVERCIVVVVSRWRFPSSSARTDVGIPLAFAPEEEFEAAMP